MQFMVHSLRHHSHQQRRCHYDAAASIKPVWDRGLDHAVEREKNLKPVLNLKNLIKSEPSKSLPLNIITQSKEFLQIPLRPVEFIRKYPSIFEEFHPGGVLVHPHIRLTPEMINFDKDENVIYQSVSYKQDVADRLLKLLMIRRMNKIPLSIIDGLKWEMGLPQDYVESVVPEFPDYFKITGGDLELVCWTNELAVSVMEKKGVEPIEFYLKYSNGFEMDKKYKKWVDEWQKLPYVSPYENAAHLAAKSDESDKWAVGVLHEILNLFVGRKAERENLLGLGECLGLRSRFKRVLLQHPGIFYVSSKIGTHTVVLKEGYKRGMLIEMHPLMKMRYRYVKLMNAGKKSKNVQKKTSRDSQESIRGEALEDDGSHEEEDGQTDDLSDEEKNDDFEDDDDKEDYKNVNGKSRGRFSQKNTFEGRGPPRTELRRSAGRNSIENTGKGTPRLHLRTEIRDFGKDHWRSLERQDRPRNRSRPERSLERVDGLRNRSRPERSLERLDTTNNRSRPERSLERVDGLRNRSRSERSLERLDTANIRSRSDSKRRLPHS